ncbi:MAG: right-handed parallel beta-helix repeat-containing protein [Candidatus Moraniibacteriota bacterium]|nr:MAG: right-handed parallel beta-helix repeat-containing protein [Candidatus Moranbacteria bacterium]
MKMRLMEGGMTLLLIAVVALPFFGFAKGGDKIYVDKDASGTQNGSSKHPYKTISQATKKADKGDEVVVSSGTYKERVTLPRGVKLSGSGKTKTIIKSDDKEDAVIEMKDNSKVWGVTVEDGRMGIYVTENAKAEIIEVRVRNNRRDGIFIENGERTDKERVSIVKSEITGNGWSGVYSQKRKLVVSDSSIQSNKRNGIMLAAGTRAWIDDNAISGNDYSGMALTLDGSDITVASKNSIRKNGREGIEVSGFGATGSIVVKKTRIAENDHYGVARLSKAKNMPASLWNGLVLQKDILFSGNAAGNISPIARAF